MSLFLRNIGRKIFIKKVKNIIESRFTNVFVKHVSSGCYECGFDCGEEHFEAYMVEENIFMEFQNFVYAYIENKRGTFNATIHDLTEEQTKKYRPEIYKKIKQKGKL